MPKTLEEMRTPLARIYRGSGRLTGVVAGERIPANDLDRATNYRWVGNLTEQEFFDEFLREEKEAFS